ncbi:unnamed protein product [Chrysoparadoxa australica]
MACNCDGGWRGADCSLRSCPEGNDVMVEPSGGTAAPQIQALCFFGTYADNEYFALTFTTQAGERYTTNPIALVKARLEALPNGVIDTVNVQAKELDKVTSLSAVVVNAATDCQLIIEVEFAGPHVSGNQNLLEVEYTKCDVEGCTPRIPTALASGLVILLCSSFSVLIQQRAGALCNRFVSQVVSSNEESYECGGRGKCDTLTGTCQCFSGYYGWHCETQTALI